MSNPSSAHDDRAGQILRPLGLLESYCAEDYAQHNGALLVVTVAELAGPLDAARAREALAVLHARHPLLRARLRRTPDAWLFEDGAGLTDIPIVTRPAARPDEWQALVEVEQRTPLPTDRCLWRATILQGPSEGPHHLLLGVHHSVADGLSLFALATQFLTAYAALAAGTAPDVAPRPLLPSVEALLPLQAPGPSGFQSFPPVEPDQLWPFEQPASAEACERRVLVRELAPADLARLEARCRAEGLTVNAALLAAADQATHVLPRQGSRFRIDVPHNVRAACVPPVPADAVGMFICDVLVERDHADTPPAFWDSARDLEARYLARLPAALQPSRTFALDALHRTIAGYRDLSAGRFQVGFVLSNLGAREAPAGPLNLERFWFGTYNAPGVMALLIMVATVRGRLCATLSWYAPLLSTASVEAFADAWLDALRAAT